MDIWVPYLQATSKCAADTAIRLSLIVSILLAISGFAWAAHSRLKPVRKVANMRRDHLDNILTYCRPRATNAVAEGLNSKIMAIKRRACGYRNRGHLTTIIFYCGGLNLYPR